MLIYISQFAAFAKIVTSCFRRLLCASKVFSQLTIKQEIRSVERGISPTA